jgi:PTH1 family peptidyl-tRNA hydrolase
VKIVAGLGNKGTKYSKNRHNTGFIAVDNLAENWENESKFDSEISKSENFIFIKPQTYMNDSGKAVSKVMNFYKISPDDLIVIHDDLDLPFSKVKKQFDAGPAGHNGIISIIEQLGTQKFWRIRVGIGRPQDSRIDPSDYVLSDFTVDELKEIQALNLEELLK